MVSNYDNQKQYETIGLVIRYPWYLMLKLSSSFYSLQRWNLNGS